MSIVENSKGTKLFYLLKEMTQIFKQYKLIKPISTNNF